MGAVFAMMPVIPGALFHRNREQCTKNCSLCKKRCPAHLDIDGDTTMSGECICCHACLTTCPKGNIGVGEPSPQMKKKTEETKVKKIA
jgi:polyferredoxin